MAWRSQEVAEEISVYCWRRSLVYVPFSLDGKKIKVPKCIQKVLFHIFKDFASPIYKQNQTFSFISFFSS
jgi:hypothetical protein